MALLYSLLLEDLSSVERRILRVLRNTSAYSKFFGVEIA
jgi:hypothetical protein